ncbi:unnamed protein product, partial [Symbiodinium microadriaticum]
MIIKRLGDNYRARKCQMDEYQRHLQQQYEDRVVYWQCRSLSRMNSPASSGLRTFCVAIDGLDHSKFKYPRSRAFVSRDFAGLHRPCLDCTGVLVHGCAALLILTEPMTAKDSSLHVDILYHVYHRLHQRGHELRSACLVLQTDNTSRECKNSSMMRALAVLVAGHKLKRAEARQLQAGHHHEDIDQFFSSISTAIQAKAEVHLPEDFANLLNEYLQNPGTRPYEHADKEAFLLDTVRDWKSFLEFGCHFNHLKGISGPGAPHTYAFDRFEDLGMERKDVNSKFWTKRGYNPHPSDVVLRTKQNMSDEEYVKPILYLPYEVFLEIAEAGSRPE